MERANIIVKQASKTLIDKYNAAPKRDDWYVVNQQPAPILWPRRAGGNTGGEVEGGPAPSATEVDWGSVGLISIFGRERLRGASWLASPRRRSTVLVHDPARPRRVRDRLSEQIRANQRRGWTVKALRGPDAGTDERASFARAYEETMRRAGAAERYFYSPAYFRTVLAFPASWRWRPGRSRTPRCTRSRTRCSAGPARCSWPTSATWRPVPKPAYPRRCWTGWR
jgi:hypothetical protein